MYTWNLPNNHTNTGQDLDSAKSKTPDLYTNSETDLQISSRFTARHHTCP
ncbi:unnamed protein product [Periconia digitata]|uniref:Uncharacterized protein n=1 Tax=Periconia digitata TaxID=1303443 RepID=A0A9W4U5P5_9PLEO|nr:unnamed protein product [Periconia digitata]